MIDLSELSRMHARSLMWMARAMLRTICVFGLPPVTGQENLLCAMGELRCLGMRIFHVRNPDDNQRSECAVQIATASMKGP